jgi:hypothetical protein
VHDDVVHDHEEWRHGADAGTGADGNQCSATKRSIRKQPPGRMNVHDKCYDGRKENQRPPLTGANSATEPAISTSPNVTGRQSNPATNCAPSPQRQFTSKVHDSIAQTLPLTLDCSMWPSHFVGWRTSPFSFRHAHFRRAIFGGC